MQEPGGLQPTKCYVRHTRVLHTLPAHVLQDERLIIAIQLTPLFQETRISIPLNCIAMTGSPLSWRCHGSNPSDLQLRRCPLQKYQCFRRHMPYLEAYKMKSKKSFAVFLIWCRQILNFSQMLTASSVITTTSSTHLLSTHGLQVRELFV